MVTLLESLDYRILNTLGQSDWFADIDELVGALVGEWHLVYERLGPVYFPNLGVSVVGIAHYGVQELFVVEGEGGACG